MSTLISIQSQIEKLQKQANEIKSKEYSKTLADIKETMAAFGITINDLKNATQSKRLPKAKGKSVKAEKRPVKTVAAKYRGPEGQLWSGRGLSPKWMNEAITTGKSKADFLIPQLAA